MNRSVKCHFILWDERHAKILAWEWFNVNGISSLVVPRGPALGHLDHPSCGYKYFWGDLSTCSIRLFFSLERFLASLVVQDSDEPYSFCKKVVPSLWSLWLIMKEMELSTLNKDQWVRFHTCTTRLLLLYSTLLLLLFFFCFFNFLCSRLCSSTPSIILSRSDEFLSNI